MADDKTLLENLIGFSLRSPAQEKKEEKLKSPFPPLGDDGALLIQDGVGGYNSTFVDFGRVVANEIDLITKYRAMSVYPDVERAVDDIINEMISFDSDGDLVELDLEDLDNVSDNVKAQITDEFKNIIRLTRFATAGYNVVKKWYVDGRLYYHIMIDPKNPRQGIQELRYIDPRKIRYIKKEIKTATYTPLVHMHDRFEEFFLYNPTLMNSPEVGMKVAKDAIAFAHSGMFDETGQVVLGQLHKALKILNQLRWMEDALVIYRITRAPERRVFTIDVEDVPPAKAQSYIENIINKHRNKIAYDSNTGEIDMDKRFMAMTEDYYLPQRSGKGTTVTQLQGGQNLGEVTDIDYFRRKLQTALNVPSSRMEQDSLFNTGRSSEITRDEVKFQKFIDRQRIQFSTIFGALLRVQLVLKGICSLSDWEEWNARIKYRYLKDTFFSEMKDNEVMAQRLDLVDRMEPYAERYFSSEYIRRKVLQQDDEEMAELKEQREKEKAEGDTNPMNDPQAAMGMMGDPNDPTGMGADPMGGPMGPPGAPTPGMMGGQGFGKPKPNGPPKKPKIMERVIYQPSNKLTEDASKLSKVLVAHADLSKGERVSVKQGSSNVQQSQGPFRGR